APPGGAVTDGSPRRPSARADIVKKAVILLAAAGILAWLIWLIDLLAGAA
ncbi:MAG: hypothetical protein JNM48_05665, partial [Rhodospirillales bacterium]|nr:hypothetical protein [Rhodospirillales bacterium]